MAAMIYDSAAGAWRDAATPLIWDAEAQAYKDSAGLVWDEQAQAWSERWGAIHYLYKNGKFFNNETFIWTRNDNTSPTVTVNNDPSAGYIEITYTKAQYWGTSMEFSFSQQIPRGTKKIGMKFSYGSSARIYRLVLILANIHTVLANANNWLATADGGSDQIENVVQNNRIELDASDVSAAGYIHLRIAANNNCPYIYPGVSGEGLRFRIEQIYYQ